MRLNGQVSSLLEERVESKAPVRFLRIKNEPANGLIGSRIPPQPAELSNICAIHRNQDCVLREAVPA